MTKKVFGYFFFALAVLALLGAMANGTLFSDQGSAPETFGKTLGILIPVALYIFSGIFMLNFEKVLQVDYLTGFRKRKGQNAKILLFTVVYGILTFFVTISAASCPWEDVLMRMLIMVPPYLIPFMIFLSFYLVYAYSYGASKKYFLNYAGAEQEYLSQNEQFNSYCADHFVLANRKALFFPKLFCVIPLHAIQSVQLKKQLWEQDVYFHLTNGKKFYVVTKHYDAIMQAIQANKQQ